MWFFYLFRVILRGGFFLFYGFFWCVVFFWGPPLLLFFFHWGAPLDSESIFIQFYRTGTSDAPGYSNPRIDGLIDKIDREMISYARDAMIEEVWKIVLDEIIHIPLHHQVIVWAMRHGLELPVYPFNRPLFRDARFK